MFDIPKNQWTLIVDHDVIRAGSTLYLIRRTDDATEAFTNTNAIKTVPEGQELPFWWKLTYDLAEELALDTAFKNVYKTRTVVDRVGGPKEHEGWIVVESIDGLTRRYFGPFGLTAARAVQRARNLNGGNAHIARIGDYDE